jgi:alkyl sulfatase BDS1-like metallo-beta-lactamase superfamily hydrolase
MNRLRFAALTLVAATTGCGAASTGRREPTTDPTLAGSSRVSLPSEPTKDASAITRLANQAARGLLPREDEEFIDASRGWMAQPTGDIRTKDGRVAWTFESYALDKAEDAPATVHPSLWRQARLNSIQGLFKVADGVYQMRGFDISNMSIIEGKTGLIVVDPLHSVETARAALDLYLQHRPKRPVVAVIHSHADAEYFGGVLGVVSEDDVRAKRVRLYAPDGFLEQAISENVYASNAMSRRAQYVYGARLSPSARGIVDGRRGQGPSTGTVSLVPPTDVIRKPLERRTIDGVEVEFQLTPTSDEPAEMNLYLPRSRVFCVSENATHAVSNAVAPRGRLVRDARTWAQYLNDALEMYGGKSTALIGQHRWPTFGQDHVAQLLGKQRDMYKHLHDQTLRQANSGGLPMAEENPADLNPLAPVDSATKLVEYMGGASAVTEKARHDFAVGNYRWVAQISKEIVLADPANREARSLLADSLEQLGYQTDNGAWRSAYLSGAQELRIVAPSRGSFTNTAEMMKTLTVPMTFDQMGIRLNAEKAIGKTLAIQVTVGDLGDKYLLTMTNAALNYTKLPSDTTAKAPHMPTPSASLTLTKAALSGLLSARNPKSLDDLIASKKVAVTGDAAKLKELFGMLDGFEAPSLGSDQSSRVPPAADPRLSPPGVSSSPSSLKTSSARSTVK